MFIKNNEVILAPMAGITDKIFRTVCKSFGADRVVSEMVSTEGLFYHSAKTVDLMQFTPSEHPVGIQIFGANPEHCAKAAAFIQKQIQPDFIDLNAGCPVSKVVRKNGGASLLKDPVLFEKILKAIVKEVSIPVTVKIRSGWFKNEWVDVQYAQIAQQCNAAAITVHPRSQTMMFSGHSFWERIAEVKKAVSIPVIGNGDILTAEDALKMFEETGCDAVMIGRGAYGNPWLFKQIKEALNGESITQVTSDMKISTALMHLDMFIEAFGESRAVKEMKKHIGWYFKGFKGASELRNAVFRASTITEMRNAVLQSKKTLYC